MLNEKEKYRYSRHLLLKEIGLDGQLKLKQAKVLVVGAGGLGCPVLQYLAAAGIGTIGIIDFDVVDVTNLQRQVLFDETDVGKLKAVVAAEKLQKQNSHICIETYCEKLTTENVDDIFKPFNIVIDCTDNFSTRYLVNDACVLLGKPLVHGSIHRFQGQVSVFNYSVDEKLPVTYRCLFPSPPEDGAVLSCSEIGVLGVLPGIIGTLQATEAIKIISGIGKILSGRLLLFDALSMQSSIIEIERNPFVESITPSSFDALKKFDYSFQCKTEKVANEISVEKLQEWLKEKDGLQLLDVRNENELPEVEELSDLKIPLFDIENNISKISRKKKVVVFCKSGIRSAHAIELLTKKYSFGNLFNLKGGVEEWLNKKIL